MHRSTVPLAHLARNQPTRRRNTRCDERSLADRSRPPDALLAPQPRAFRWRDRRVFHRLQRAFFQLCGKDDLSEPGAHRTLAEAFSALSGGARRDTLARDDPCVVLPTLRRDGARLALSSEDEAVRHHLNSPRSRHGPSPSGGEYPLYLSLRTLRHGGPPAPSAAALDDLRPLQPPPPRRTLPADGIRGARNADFGRGRHDRSETGGISGIPSDLSPGGPASLRAKIAGL